MIKSSMSILILTLCLSHCSTIDTADVGLAIIQEYMASDKMKITNLEQCLNKDNMCINND